MTRYEKYKPTNIEWIGEIPEHWQVKKLKYIGEAIIGITYSPDDISDEENGLLVLRSSNIQDGKLAFEDCVYVSKDVKEKHLTKEGDVLLCARNGSAHLVGKSALIRKEHINITWGAFMSIFRSSIGEFAYQFFNSQIFKSQTGLFATSTINQLTTDTLNNLFVPLPLPEEQTDIANYLDEKTAQIDKLIANKQRLIDLMIEEKKVLINESVTGKNKNWNTVKFNHYIRLRHGYQFMNYDFTSTGIKVVKITQLSADGYLDLSEATYIDATRLTEFEDILINEGDILMALTGGTIGKIIRVGKVDEPLLQNYRVGNFFPASPKITKDFIFWLLSSEHILSQIFFEQRETGQPNIGKENFNSFKIYLPSIEEQNQVVNFLNIETQRIDSALTNIKKEIELIEEYKSSLISEVVTGKQKVVN